MFLDKATAAIALQTLEHSHHRRPHLARTDRHEVNQEVLPRIHLAGCLLGRPAISLRQNRQYGVDLRQRIITFRHYRAVVSIHGVPRVARRRYCVRSSHRNPRPAPGERKRQVPGGLIRTLTPQSRLLRSTSRNPVDATMTADKRTGRRLPFLPGAPDGNAVRPAMVMCHVQVEPAEPAAELIDSPEELVRLVGASVALDVAFAIEQNALQIVHPGDDSDLFRPGERRLWPAYTRRAPRGRKWWSYARRTCHRVTSLFEPSPYDVSVLRRRRWLPTSDPPLKPVRAGRRWSFSRRLRR